MNIFNAVNGKTYRKASNNSNSFAKLGQYTYWRNASKNCLPVYSGYFCTPVCPGNNDNASKIQKLALRIRNCTPHQLKFDKQWPTHVRKCFEINCVCALKWGISGSPSFSKDNWTSVQLLQCICLRDWSCLAPTLPPVKWIPRERPCFGHNCILSLLQLYSQGNM